ncbi:hypothetical protein M4914_06855 [Streptomyces somaliensis DSM 40738]|uniref:Uncharacterized protein n=1 Tax=Streptomyces somaliensis (strain ATCC 33201 / DSM 40738 / JCM 12659 / KCTC 9044 / NCTC 11332 / NRRL B-12077 / IP 733) TaxID=1134445 RepID=A0AA44DDK9_STRE0|nr:hypothetical protein [Streptomyces somaliensis]MCQ0022700.1 hypothetical protein [Streptomyces somaliensis DSM 40738]NKY14956.1 hypothetical protein [Streptomyces somaliensis DSM 40738]
MKIYVTSLQQSTLDLWSRLLPESTAIELVNQNSRSVRADVLVMSGVWAFDRYGGRPNRETAQILSNSNGDGLPDWIAVPPFRPIVEQDGGFSVREDFRQVSPAYYAVLQSLRAVRNEFGDSVSVILDLTMLGMDDPRDESTPASVARAVEVFLNQ